MVGWYIATGEIEILSGGDRAERWSSLLLASKPRQEGGHGSKLNIFPTSWLGRKNDDVL
jgi:hypothetical protein